jgi:hypothetical protein
MTSSSSVIDTLATALLERHVREKDQQEAAGPQKGQQGGKIVLLAGARCH